MKRAAPVLAVLSLLLLVSCPERIMVDVTITGGFISGTGNTFELNYSLNGESADEATRAQYRGGPDLSKTVTFENAGIHVVDGFNLDGTVTPDQGAEIEAFVDTAEDLGYTHEAYETMNTYWYFRFVKQRESIQIDNQFYFMAPVFDSFLYDIALVTVDGGSFRAWMRYPCQTNRVSFDAESLPFKGSRLAVEVRNFETGEISYLDGTGALVPDPVAFDPEVTFAPGQVLDASSLVISPVP